MASFKDAKCYDFNKLITASKKDDTGKVSWIAPVKEISLETDYDRNLGAWTYELVWAGSGDVKRAKLTPFSFKQLCTKFKCPSKFMLELPGNIAKQNLDFFRADMKEDELLIKVKQHEEGFYYARGIVKPSTPILSNTELLRAIEDPVAKYGMKVWKGYFRDHDFHTKLIYGDEINVGTLQSPDNVNIGVHIANSEVGARALEIQIMVFRLVCTNGMIHQVDGVPLIRKTAFGTTRDELAREVGEAFKKIENRKEQILGVFQDAQKVEIKNPYWVISQLAKTHKLSKSQVVAITEEFNKGFAIGEYHKNKFGVLNSITKVAQGYDAETRLGLESVAGKFLVDQEIAVRAAEAYAASTKK